MTYTCPKCGEPVNVYWIESSYIKFDERRVTSEEVYKVARCPKCGEINGPPNIKQDTVKKENS